MDFNDLGGILSMCPKNFKSFHTFFAEKRRLECKKYRDSQQNCLKMSRPMLEKRGSPRYKITIIFVPRSNISGVLSV